MIVPVVLVHGLSGVILIRANVQFVLSCDRKPFLQFFVRFLSCLFIAGLTDPGPVKPTGMKARSEIVPVWWFWIRLIGWAVNEAA